MHHSRILKRAFQSRTTEQRQNEKICQDIDDVSGEDYETETLRRRKIGKRSQKAGPRSELGVLHPRQIGIWRNRLLK
jgi:hypothetical protein